MSISSHHWMENYSSLGSKLRSRLGGVTSSQRMQHEVLTQRAAKPCQQVMMLSTTMRTGSLLISFDSTLWWTGEAVIASTEITSDGETMPYIYVP